MSETIKPPKDWKFRLNKTASALTSALGDHRILSIKALLNTSGMTYSAVTVKDEGLGKDWTGWLGVSSLASKLGSTYRLTALDCFEDDRETLCAAAWVKDPSPVDFGWGYDLTPADVDAKVAKDGGKLISIRAYRTTLGGTLTSPGIRYCAIWLNSDGGDWGWVPDSSARAIAKLLEAKSARLVSIDNFGEDRFCAVWYRTGPAWFWNIGLDETALPLEPPKFCSWPLDVSHCSPTAFVSLLEQYPKPADPAAATLMSLHGSATTNFKADLWQEITWTATEENLAGEQVNITDTYLFVAAEGGWCWRSGHFTPPSSTHSHGLPMSLPAAAIPPKTEPWGPVSNAPKHSAYSITAETAGGKHQSLTEQIAITNPGFSTPPPMQTAWPVMLGIIAPVEAVRLTNGDVWICVIAQIVNCAGRKLDVTNAYVQLRDQNGDIVQEEYRTKNMLIDTDSAGAGIDPWIFGPVANSDVPFPKFYVGMKAPRNWTNGSVKVQGLVKYPGDKHGCFGDDRILPVTFAPELVIPRLPYDTPVVSGMASTSHHWRWGSGVGSPSFTAHSYPEHRYSYDIVVENSDHIEYADETKKDKNENYYAWDQPVRAMEGGRVRFREDGFEENFGNVRNPLSKGANVVVIEVTRGTDTFFHQYVHLKKDSIPASVTIGSTVAAGDELGHVGNNGTSSGPHLHLGVSRRDEHGFLRSLPMTFNNIKNKAGTLVSGVPVDGETYS